MNPPSQDTVIALIQKDIQNINKATDEIKQSIKEMGGFFINVSEFVAYKKLIETELNETKIERDEMRGKVSIIERNMWMGLGALSVITFGLKFFIK